MEKVVNKYKASVWLISTTVLLSWVFSYAILPPNGHVKQAMCVYEVHDTVNVMAVSGQKNNDNGWTSFIFKINGNIRQ